MHFFASCTVLYYSVIRLHVNHVRLKYGHPASCPPRRLGYIQGSYQFITIKRFSSPETKSFKIYANSCINTVFVLHDCRANIHLTSHQHLILVLYASSALSEVQCRPLDHHVQLRLLPLLLNYSNAISIFATIVGSGDDDDDDKRTSSS